MSGRSAILMLRDEGGLSDHLRTGGFIVTNRGGAVRISFHEHNTEDDISRLLACLKAFRPLPAESV
jgi:selenocysteine lyase/cysteine desulfurase